MPHEVEGDDVEMLAERDDVLRIGLDMPADAMHQEQRFGIVPAGLRNAHAPEGRRIHVTDFGTEEVDPD